MQVKLFTKSGVQKYKTDCAPNNGYFLIPLYDKVCGWVPQPFIYHQGKICRFSMVVLKAVKIKTAKFDLSVSLLGSAVLQ